MCALPVPPRRPAPPETPEDLYGTLQGNDPEVRDLWSHQADALRTYVAEHRASPNVALEFPTGAGKTLVGLLIAAWRRRKLKERAAFVCPTIQLAHQAMGKATDYGLEAVLLVESHREWPEADRAAFESGNAVAITNYHHIFNSSPKIEAQTLILDDAHAGEPAVAGRWSIEAKRGEELYDALRQVVEPALPPHFARLLREDSVDPRVRFDVELVSPTATAHREAEIATAIETHVKPGSPSAYAWSTVRSGLRSCLMYVSWSGILLRPLVAPTATLPAFADAKQRVYMSATLGLAGELERSFGVTKIDRIPLPRSRERHGSGRRFPMFPSLIDETDATIAAAMTESKRSLLIAPSDREADKAATAVVPPEIPILNSGDIREAFDPFTEQETAVLVLANRYDGMDLPGDACRLVVLQGLPLGTHLQERFLFDSLGAREALEERIRTRITQGMGRATRSRQDFAVVLFREQKLVSFLSREDVRASMRPELQAELELGLDYADQGIGVVEAMRAFYAQGDEWRPVEERLRERADELDAKPMPGADSLSAAAPHEIHAWEHAWRGNFAGARDHGRRAAEALVGDSVKQYRALWRYLVASWAQLVAEDSGEEGDGRLAAAARRDAETAFNPLRWYPRFGENVEVAASGPEYDWRLDRTLEWLRSKRWGVRLNRELEKLGKRIESDEYKSFELGLQSLGEMLGFESIRPNDRADPDCAWREGGDLWLLWEAKTMEHRDAPLSAGDVRQANSHHTWVGRQLGWPEPQRSATMIVCAREEVHPDAAKVADARVALVPPEAVRDIARRTTAALSTIAAEGPSLGDEQLRVRVGQLFAEQRLGSAELAEELTGTPIAGDGKS
jgi:hypothetical protein